ncbi:helix-turn-helix domain-containing protein [Streptomyces sp. NPDC026589]|uniref:helix-turn-helix domain-containing protein n=1 Tax=Streptomyces sp. NPDC026589 TaxID=3155609 RepID=UPI0033E8BA49
MRLNQVDRGAESRSCGAFPREVPAVPRGDGGGPGQAGGSVTGAATGFIGSAPGFSREVKPISPFGVRGAPESCGAGKRRRLREFTGSDDRAGISLRSGCTCLEFGVMQLRYAFRLEPTPFQQMMLARTFGCARVVFNDALALRRAAYTAKEPWIGAGDLSKTVLTQGKKREGRTWLGEVSSVVLQQSLRDLSPPTVPSSTPAAASARGHRSVRPPSNPARTKGRRCASPRTPAGRSPRRAG